MLQLDRAATLLSRALRCDLLIYVEAGGEFGVRLTGWRFIDARLVPMEPALRPHGVPPWLLEDQVGTPLLTSPDQRRLRMVVRRDLILALGWDLYRSDGFDAVDLGFASSMLPILDVEVPATESDDAVESATFGLRSAAHDGAPAGPGASQLTRRQLDILTLVGEGLTAEAVARQVGISARTVQKHLEQAYRKIGCHDRLSAVLFLQQAGLLSSRGPRPAT